MMRRKVQAIGLLIALVVLGAQIFGQVSEAQTPTPNKSMAGDLSQLSRVGFQVKEAGWLPFAKPKPLVFVQELPQDTTAVDIDYVAGAKNYVRITTINRPVNLISDKHQVQQVTLGNGHAAKFLDNGAAQILFWSDGKMSYQIVAAKPSGPYKAADLARVAVP